MADFGSDPGLWVAKGAGAVAGAAVSLVYMLPRGRREAASRFVTGVACGMIFGGPTGVWLSAHLGIAGRLTGGELVMSGAAAASLTAWWVLGAVVRVAKRFGREPVGK